jgi:hypothetical protein
MHDNENTAVEATKEIIKKFGGTLIELQNDGKRLINFSLKDEQFTIDPNRIFTGEGIVKTLKNNGEYSIEAVKETNKFAAKLKNLLKDVRLVIAVHNNSNENYSVKSYQAGGEYDTDAKLVNLEPQMDIDDFFFVTDDSFFRKLKAKIKMLLFRIISMRRTTVLYRFIAVKTKFLISMSKASKDIYGNK